MARYCFKCGVTSNEDSTLTFHRFPKPSVNGSLKARVWAKYCFPDRDWTSDESLINLNKQHKMLCSKHFDNSSFTSDKRQRLHKFAIPTEACIIMAELRNEQLHSSTETQMVSDVSASTSQCSVLVKKPEENRGYRPSQVVSEVSASTSQCLVFIKNADEYKPQSHTLTKDSHQRKSMIEEMGVKSVAELSPRKQKIYRRCRKNLTEILRLRKKLRM